jgi:hypothetical protein
MDDEVKRLLETMRQENAAAHVDTRRYFDVVADDLRHRIETVAEGVGTNRTAPRTSKRSSPTICDARGWNE